MLYDQSLLMFMALDVCGVREEVEMITRLAPTFTQPSKAMSMKTQNALPSYPDCVGAVDIPSHFFLPTYKAKMFILQFSNPAHYTPLLEKSQTPWRYWSSWNGWVSSFLLVRKWEWHRRMAASLQHGRCWPPAQTKQKNKSSHSLMRPDYVSGSLSVQE